MLHLIDGLPDDVIGFSADKYVTKEDYQDVLVPAIEATVHHHDKFKMIYRFGPEFKGFEGAALWEDAKVGMHHLGEWKKIAIVTDHTWLAEIVKEFGHLMPGEVKVFGDDDFADAKTWIKA